jgi:GxxExxY protein
MELLYTDLTKEIMDCAYVEALAPIHTAQLLTYLKLSGCRVGFIMNFNVQSMKEGIKRFVL